MINRYQKYGPDLIEKGYELTPVHGKRPILEGWSKRPKKALKFDQFPDANIGILTGGVHNLIGIDVDVVNPKAANELLHLIENELGFAPRRIGQEPKFLMVFRCTEKIQKHKTGVYEIDGKDCQVEILAEGQQFVASGKHPDTRRNYKWPDDKINDIAVDQLTEVTPGDITRILSMATTIMAEYGQLKGRVSTRKTVKAGGLNLNQLDGEMAEIQTAIGYIPNDDEHYDDWINTLHAIKGALGGDGYELAHRWSRKSTKYDAEETDRAWHSIKQVNHIGAGSIHHWAAEHGFDLKKTRQAAIDKLKPKTELPPSPLLKASEITGPIPDREWCLDQWFPARAVSVLFGQGGVGKTLLIHQLANCVASGRDFMGIETRKMPVLAIHCEDDTDEIKRRQLSINDWLGLNEITQTGPANLYIWPRVGQDNILVTFPNQGEDKPSEFYPELCNTISDIKTREQADEILIILDTAADMFGGNENIRREVNTFCKSYLGSFCTNYNATVILLAHPSLTGLNTGSGLSGSTAWENSVRARAYFSRTDADNDEIRTLTRKKANYASVGRSSDITLMWDAGVYQLPTRPDQIDRLEQKALKNKILDAVDAAFQADTPFRAKSGRPIKTALPAEIGEPPQATFKAFQQLQNEGFIGEQNRSGYQVFRRPNP